MTTIAQMVSVFKSLNPPQIGYERIPQNYFSLGAGSPTDVAVAERNPTAVAATNSPIVEPIAKPTPRAVEVNDQRHLAKYTEVAKKVGVMPPELSVENFKLLLRKLDLPVYNLREVISYMDRKAEQESKEKAGWHWVPLRNKDWLDADFGSRARRDAEMIQDRATGQVHQRVVTKPGSDYYSGDNGKRIYKYIVPLHALERVLAIEQNYEGKVAFMVSDYVLAKDIPHPDPFLMAVIPNEGLHVGIGRFIIDFWDEPGFGIKEMLK